MPFNAKPLILYENLFSKGGTLSATDTDSGSAFSVDNIINQVAYQLWKAASAGTKYITVDLNKAINGGFETGNFFEWEQRNSAISAVTFHSGAFSAGLAAIGAPINGARKNVAIDTNKVNTVSAYVKVGPYVAGTCKFEVVFLDSDGVLISTFAIHSITQAVAFTLGSMTIGPTGSGADSIYPAGTASINVQHVWVGGAAEGTSWVDDVLVYENTDPDTLGIANHNLWDANATISLESSDDDTEVISSWTERLAEFTPASTDKDIILKQFTAVGSAERAWRLKIVTANMVPYIGDMKLGARLDFPRWTQGPFGPRPRKAEGKLATNDAGQFLQRVVIRKEVAVTLRFRRLTSTFVWDTLMPAFENELISGMFYVSWDIDQHEEQKMLCYVPDGAVLDPKYSGALLDGVDLTVMPMPVA